MQQKIVFRVEFQKVSEGLCVRDQTFWNLLSAAWSFFKMTTCQRGGEDLLVRIRIRVRG